MTIAAAAIDIGLTEAESLTLSGGYEIEQRAEASGGATLKTGSSGIASGKFTGPAGDYWLEVWWFNESDGQSPFTLEIDGIVIDTWTGTGGSGGAGTVEPYRIPVVLNEGSVIEITGAKDAGEYARLDYLNVVERTEPVSPPEPPADGSFAVGVTEAESLTLSGDYAVETRSDASGGEDIKSSGTGAAAGTFIGETGNYQVDVYWFNENDGEATFVVRINGEVVETWTGTGGSGGAGRLVTHSFVAELSDGYVIEFEGTKDAGEYARIDYIEINSTDAPPPPPPPPPPPEEIAGIGIGTTEAESLSLEGGYQIETRSNASGGALIKSSNTGVAKAEFTDAAGDYWLDVTWFNERDGEAEFFVSVDGLVVDSWTGTGGTGNSGAPEDRRIAVTLENGSLIEISGSKDAGEFARVDYLTIGTRDGDPPPPPPPPPSEAIIALGQTEAETLELSGDYIVENRVDASAGADIKAEGQGTATGTYSGADGDFWFDVVWFNESDGESIVTVSVNGDPVQTWTGTGGSGGAGTPELKRVALSLADGDTITIDGIKSDGEFARIDYVELSAREAPPEGFDITAFDFFAFTGQSNAERHFRRVDGDDSPGILGYQVFEIELETLSGADVTAIEAARGGSGSNPLADDSSFWWDIENDRPGNALLEAVSTIDAALASGGDLDGIIWSQGEDDARAIMDDLSNQTQIVDALIDATVSTFEYFWSLYGADVPIFIQEMGEFPEGDGTWVGNPVGALSAIRDAQAQIIDTYDNVYLGASTAGLGDLDTIHFDVAGYGEIAEDLAQSAFDVITAQNDWIA